MFTQTKNRFRSGILFFLLTFVANTCYVPLASAQGMVLPAPGVRVSMSPAFTPSIIRGMTIDTKNPFAFSFLIDKGDDNLSFSDKNEQYELLIKYFLSAMTIPEEHQWVNLSPYEEDRIIEQDFGQTEMGRDLLGQDYYLKQITASLVYPEEQLGQEFWAKIYKEAQEKFGTTQIPVNTFNKVWITPESADIFEKDSTVLIVNSKLKVMLEEDYLAVEKNRQKVGASMTETQEEQDQETVARDLGKKVLKEIVIPQLTKEVNEGKNFANLRQIYHGMILAAWYKQNLKESILTQIYADKGKVKGIDLNDPLKAQQEVYQQYLQAFKKGVYNYIKEEMDPILGEVIPRKYFSGGFAPNVGAVLGSASEQAAAKLVAEKGAQLDDVKTVVVPADVKVIPPLPKGALGMTPFGDEVRAGWEAEGKATGATPAGAAVTADAAGNGASQNLLEVPGMELGAAKTSSASISSNSSWTFGDVFVGGKAVSEWFKENATLGMNDFVWVFDPSLALSSDPRSQGTTLTDDNADYKIRFSEFLEQLSRDEVSVIRKGNDGFLVFSFGAKKANEFQSDFVGPTILMNNIKDVKVIPPLPKGALGMTPFGDEVRAGWEAEGKSTGATPAVT